MQDIEFEGSIFCNIKNLEIPEEYLYFFEEVFLISPEELIEQINGNTILYSGVISVKDNKVSLNIGLQDQDNNVETLFEFIFEDKTVYISKELFDEIDGLEYDETGKYVVLSIEDVADIIISDMIDSILSYPSYPDEIEFEDSSYYFGFEKGLSDGFFEMEYDDEIPEDWELFELDSEVFAQGYKDGYEYGHAQIEPALEQAQKLEELKEPFVNKASAANLIKAYQNLWKTSGDEFFGNFFSQLELGVVEKDNNKYTISLDNENVLGLLGDSLLYIIEHFDGLGPSLKTIISNLSDDDLLLILVDPDDRQEILDGLDELFPAPTETEIELSKEEIEGIIDLLRSEIGLELEYNSTFEKTGAISFESESTYTIKYVDYFTLDFDIVSTLSVNKDKKGDNKVVVDKVTATEAGASLNIENTNEDVFEVGIIYSKSSDLSDFVKVAGQSDDNSTFKVNITGLEPKTTYYYKTYFIDAGHNTLYSDEVFTFTTQASSPQSPKTGSTSSNLWLLYTLTVSLSVMIALRKRTKTV